MINSVCQNVDQVRMFKILSLIAEILFSVLPKHTVTVLLPHSHSSVTLCKNSKLHEFSQIYVLSFLQTATFQDLAAWYWSESQDAVRTYHRQAHATSTIQGETMS